VGATLRVYLEALETDPSRLDREPAEALAAVAQAADEIAGIRRHTGREGPDVVT
jgi:phosphoglucomutase